MMELYIGGYAQGKTEYVKRLYNTSKLSEMYEDAEKEEVFIWNHFHMTVKKMLAEGKNREDIMELVQQAEKNCTKLVIISDEIGNGIVPMEKEDRFWREETGRILCRIAEQADKVERIICGIPQRIK